MGESGGGAAFAVIVGVLGLVAIIAGIRGTYLDVWAVLRAGPPDRQGSNASTGSGTFSRGGHTVS